MIKSRNLPVCIRMCIVSLSLRANPFPQTVHSKALVPVIKKNINYLFRESLHYFHIGTYILHNMIKWW